MRFTFIFLLLSCIQFVVAQHQNHYKLSNFYSDDAQLAKTVDSIYAKLTEKQRIAQMIISCGGELGKSNAIITQLVKDEIIGGVVFLKGVKKEHKAAIANLNTITKTEKNIPLLFSMDAEPSLLTGRIQGMPDVGQTIDIKNFTQSDSIVSIINTELKDIGVHHNYAPVLDVSSENEAIKSRSYGRDKDSVIRLANRFIKCSQADGIIATAKHFPGHGLVQGDTHKQSVYIDGPLQEVNNYYPVIEQGVLSIMVAHITVKNNETFSTNGLPASCSRRIVTDLLKDGMCFEGLVISDALNIMKAVTILENAPLLASKAGCDLILMPQDERATLQTIQRELQKDEAYKKQIEQSVKKILRLKVCAGII
ncbi:glycoside hydrolase family 3 N-terminal domain-containing protein [Aquimarina brevivitae]|uniref:beta-N-acetylhexosaminidase n=1 Tax=Aquimarina brevivitae TaxID=323412 RepID=A0A4Q7PHG9_9FLAO|nr:glycoside hydrolase family 3 N-terminal domain-containing protein [Aquimarina brevivitae]RZS99240.1 beta-N-acetylhexosaminidase [Aquimarina brevivitae]